MTESTGQQYWLKRINDARQRYMAWAKQREPAGAPLEQWLRWQAWRNARRDYFDNEINKYRITRRNLRLRVQPEEKT